LDGQHPEFESDLSVTKQGCCLSIGLHACIIRWS
jgi:hypothetical protein